jgi:DNA-binding response OmpR family regulator
MAQILLLEDDAQLARQIQTLLGMDGHHVETFGNASDALFYFKESKVDLVIADLFIRVEGKLVPDGGILLISNIRQLQGKTTPVIAISGSFAEDMAEYTAGTAMTVGANVTIAKPFHPDKLTATVERLLKHTTDAA